MTNMLSNTWRKVGLELKLQILIQGFLFVVLIGAQLWITARFEQQTLNAAAVRAATLADGAIDGLNTMMVAKGKDDDVIRDEKIRSLYIQEIGAGPNIREVRIVRAPSIDKEFGDGLAQERPRDDMDRGVLATGKTATRVSLGADGAAELRAVVPFIAEKTTRSTNCVKCHDAQVGSAIGAASVTLDIKDDLARISSLNTWIWIGQAVLQVVLFFVIGWIVRRLLSQLGGEPAYVIDIATRISRGDLSGEVRTRPGDNNSLLAAMSRMQTALQGMISGALQTAMQLNDAARGLVVSSHQVLSAAERESDASASVAAAVEEMTVCIGQISENAGSAQHHAAATGALAKDGSTAMQDVIVEMDKISESVATSSGVISTLGERSRQISAIVNVIKEIADQTNLLALNAAIEAARAGEQGRGFAVVADEVRKLAERTSHSTTEIAAMVQAIQDGTADAVAGMANGSACVTNGVQRVETADGAMTRIQEGVQQVLASVDDISASLREQSATSNLIARNVEEFARMSDETTRVMREVNNSADRLEQLAAALKASVGQFKV